MGASNTFLSLLLPIVICHVSWTNGQRRAVVHYDVDRSSSLEVPETFSENPISSSINSIQTGREELIAFHKGETGLGVDPRRGFSKTTTPDYSEEFAADGDGTPSGKAPKYHHSKSPESDTGIPGNVPQNQNNENLKGYEDLADSRNRRHGVNTSVLKNEEDSAFEALSSSFTRNGTSVSSQEKHNSNKQPQDAHADIETSRQYHSTTERNTSKREEVKLSMDDNKGTALRDHDRRNNPSESRRQTTTPSFPSSGRFNTTMKEDRHREDLPEKSHNERLNRERRPPVSAENPRGQRSSEKPSFDKPQATHTPASRTPTTERHDRVEQPSVSVDSHERKILDLPVNDRDSFGIVDEKTKDLSRESDHRDKTYQTENDRRTKAKEERPVSTVLNKPTRLDIGGRTVDTSSVYTDALRGDKDYPDGKVDSEAVKSSSVGGEGKAYVEKHYAPDDERSPAHRSRHTDRDYSRRHRDQYDERPYVERPLKDSQTHRERNTTYVSQDRTASRGYRPRDGDYDERYKDSEYPYRDTAKDSSYTSRDRTRQIDERHQYSRGDYDTGDRYGGDRNYKNYTDERWYRDEGDRDNTRWYSDEDGKKLRSDRRRTYDDYDDPDRSRDYYDRRYERDGELRNYGDNDTRRYGDSEYRRYDVDATRIYREDYDRPTRRYKDEDEYKFNSTQRYRGDYDTYRDDDRGITAGSRTPHRYDEVSGTRNTRYDDDEVYRSSRGYSSRDTDQKYGGTGHDDSSRQRSASRKVVADDVQRPEEGSRRYHDDTRIYVESSSKDRYDQDDNRRPIEEHGSPAFSGTLSYQDRSGAGTRRTHDDTSRHKEGNSSRRSHVDSVYRSHHPRAEDEYYDSSTSSGNVDKYESSGRRTDDDTLGFPDREGTNRQYPGRSNNGRRRDRVHAGTPDGRRVPDAGDSYKDRVRPYDEDYRSDRSRIDTYDERRYRSPHYDDRDDDKYVSSSDDRVKTYDTRPYRDPADDVNTRNYRAKGDAAGSDRYRDDVTTRDRTTDDQFEKPRRMSERNQDQRYADRSYGDDGYGDESYEGTPRYRTEGERYPSTSSDGRKPEYRNPDRRNRGSQKFYDDYDVPQERDSTIPRSTEEKRRGGERSNRREDRYASDRSDFDGRVPSRTSKADKGIRGDVKSVIQARGTDASLQKGEVGSPYEDETKIDGLLSHTRGTQPEGRIHRTGYTSHSDNRPPKPRTSVVLPDNLDKGDFAKGRRTPFYNEDEKTDSDRDEEAKVLTDDKHFRRTDENKGVSYPRNESSRSSTYATTDPRPADRVDLKPNSEGPTYSRRVDTSDSNRRAIKDETPISKAPADLLPTSGNVEYTERKDDSEKPPISQRNKETPRTRYSSDERSSRRRLPSSREPEADRPMRRDDTEFKPSESSFSPDGQRRYHYTKSRGDPEDFSRRDDDGDEYNSRGTNSKGHDSGRRDMPKGDFGNPGSATPTRNKDERILDDPGYKDKEGRYPASRDRVSLQNGKTENGTRSHKEFDTTEEVSYDRNNSSRDERRIYESRDRDRSSSQDELRNRDEDTLRDQFENSKREVHANKENDRISPVVSQTIPIVRDEGLSVSRSATPIPHYPEKDFVRRNTTSRIGSDRMSGVPINREKRFQYDDAHNTSRSSPGMNDEQPKRPFTTKEVIDAAYRHSDEPEKQKEIYYPVYVPVSSNMTSPDIIRPSERRGITTPTKKKKKKW